MHENHDAETLHALVDYWADTKPDHIGYRFEGRETSFGAFRDQTVQLSRALRAAGIAPGDRIAWIGKNSDRYFTLLFGASRAGAVTVPIGWRLAPKEMAYIIEDSGAVAIVATPEFADLAKEVAADITAIKWMMASEEGWAIDGPETFMANFGDAPELETLSKPSDPLVQLYTSGTTGNPKGVVLTHGNFFRAGDDTPAEIPDWDIWEEDEAGLQVMPIAHIAGTGYGISPMNRGVSCNIVAEFNPGEILDLIHNKQLTRFFLVPAALQMLINDPKAADTDTSGVVQINYGASPMPLQLLRDCMKAFPNAGFCQFYGMTETTGTIVVLPPEDHDPEGNERMRSAGKPVPGVEVKIVDENGKEVGVREVGEICTRSASNMAHYFKQPEKTADTVDSDGWLRTGDAAYRDEDGYIYIHDRMKDMIITGGENVYPAEVENALYEHPAVSEAAVIGVPDEKWGEAVKAIVVTKPDASFDESEVITFCRERIAGFKTPKTVDVIPEMPRNASGKILRKDLRAPYWEGKERQVN
ncbi:long-chain-fatty-acid--CoA ligase [Parasphingopyxis sp. CP4]|uniref:long-chain-fatty-acid--CoA ligase n=1 Tax=Parasphingopyxis sp. CP4 TaxID=2724527 RepID=UPI0015A4369F|nr:long-chain-fatty-acid--CoA ligase [Parasphingopyxis sp. CP4]QLC21855.1 long-chain-fatty-acid--CoA ligase [Parasphingopyxis sp. CP4]